MNHAPFPGFCEVCAESLAALNRKCADHAAADAARRGERLNACVRYYPNGEFRREDRTDEDLPTWLEYNRRFRPGNTLFVAGECVERGALSAQDCRNIERALATGAVWKPR